MTEAIGWISSLILLLTICKQIHKQWQNSSSQGVSKWLFLGQMAASAGFTVYSWMVSNSRLRRDQCVDAPQRVHRVGHLASAAAATSLGKERNTPSFFQLSWAIKLGN